jgi:hypothetical protein
MLEIQLETWVTVERTRVDTPARQSAVAALQEHGAVLLAAARVITLDEDEAQDLVQATFEIALRQLKDLSALTRPRRPPAHLGRSPNRGARASPDWVAGGSDR